MKKTSLDSYYFENKYINEIGIDEAGRGPMFGRVYAAAVVLPKDNSFRHELMKDSKKFHSVKKIQEAAEYIKQNSIAWCVEYSTEKEIDLFNIRKATHMAMHKAVLKVIEKIGRNKEYHLLVDGNDFTDLTMLQDVSNCLISIPYTCIEGGDNKYSSIAAASILAKVSRDEYINEMCDMNLELEERYGIRKNKGYGTKNHMEGIQKYGITEYHRKTFGVCRKYS
jgi:ribonuclease HII